MARCSVPRPCVVPARSSHLPQHDFVRQAHLFRAACAGAQTAGQTAEQLALVSFQAKQVKDDNSRHAAPTDGCVWLPAGASHRVAKARPGGRAACTRLSWAPSLLVGQRARWGCCACGRGGAGRKCGCGGDGQGEADLGAVQSAAPGYAPRHDLPQHHPEAAAPTTTESAATRGAPGVHILHVRRAWCGWQALRTGPGLQIWGGGDVGADL